MIGVNFRWKLFEFLRFVESEIEIFRAAYMHWRASHRVVALALTTPHPYHHHHQHHKNNMNHKFRLFMCAIFFVFPSLFISIVYVIILPMINNRQRLYSFCCVCFALICFVYRCLLYPQSANALLYPQNFVRSLFAW